MRQTTSKLLYNYWNTVRDGQPAPKRFDIEPVKIAALLPETFILECGGLANYRFRLAGTRICEQFGRELRGSNFVELWGPSDQESVANLMHNVVMEKAVAGLRFDAVTVDGRKARFELLLLPLVHLGSSVNRILGCISAIDPPYWLGSTPLIRYSIRSLDLDWPSMRNASGDSEAPLAIFSDNQAVTLTGDARRRFRVYEGGLSDERDRDEASDNDA